MRFLAPLVLATLATGCAEGLQFRPTSTLYTSARGVALFDDADVESGAVAGSQVGMNGTTCAVDPYSATISSDYDYPGTEEVVTDATVDPEDGDVVVIVTSDKGVHAQTTNGWDTTSQDWEIEGAHDAQALDEGAIVMRGDVCAAEIVGSPDRGTVRLPGQACDGPTALETDPMVGAAWFGNGDGLWRIEGLQTVQISEEPAELVAFDPQLDVLYTARAGDSVVTALGVDGDVVWSVDVGGAVTSLDDLGAWQAVAVTVTLPDTTGTLLVLDGLTGLVRADTGTPGPAVVQASRDGNTVALVRGNEVGFYRTELGYDGPQVDVGDVIDILVDLE